MAPFTGKLVPTDTSAVYVVTGGNRGLGIEHVKQFLEKTDAKVVATARQPSKADALNALAKKHQERVSVVELDTSSEPSIEVQTRDQVLTSCFHHLVQPGQCWLATIGRG